MWKMESTLPELTSLAISSITEIDPGYTCSKTKFWLVNVWRILMEIVEGGEWLIYTVVDG